MLLNPIFAMLQNTKTDRYHPILFAESPMAGPEYEGKPVRHRSKGHHTDGFSTRDEALQSIEDTIEKMGQPCGKSLRKEFPWDGEDIPAMVVFFGATASGEYAPVLA